MKRKIKIFFWAFWLFAMSLSLIEVVTYNGFILKHLGFNPAVIIIVTVFFAVLAFKYNNPKIQEKNNWTFILFILILLFYVVLKIINHVTYTNFVFSKLHIQPDNLVLTILVSNLAVLVWFLPIFVSYIIKIILRTNYKKYANSEAVITFFALLLIVFNFRNIYLTEKWAYRFIITNPFASYGVKMSRAVGSVFYNYTQFIVKNTPQDSRILIPPQAFPWPQSGNGAFLRYFVYPRSLRVGGEYLPGEKVSLKDFDYVLLDWGETPTTEGKYTHGWPKFDVPAENIIFMNLDGSFAGEAKGDYHYKDYLSKEVWGLIKVKH